MYRSRRVPGDSTRCTPRSSSKRSHKAVHANFTPAERHKGQFADLPFKRPASEANTKENYHLKPRWLRDQRNSWHGVDFPYHSELDIEKFYKDYCESDLARLLEAVKARDPDMVALVNRECPDAPAAVERGASFAR